MLPEHGYPVTHTSSAFGGSSRRKQFHTACVETGAEGSCLPGEIGLEVSPFEVPLGRVQDGDSPARSTLSGVHAKGEGFRRAIDLHIRCQWASGPLAAHFQTGMGLLPRGMGAVEDQGRQIPFRQAD